MTPLWEMEIVVLRVSAGALIIVVVVDTHFRIRNVITFAEVFSLLYSFVPLAQ